MEYLAFPTTGFVIESERFPQVVIESLEGGGFVSHGSRTIDGAYVEPLVPLARLLANIEMAGVRVRGVRSAGRGGGNVAWGAGAARRRLRDPHSPEWLPTLPCA